MGGCLPQVHVPMKKGWEGMHQEDLLNLKIFPVEEELAKELKGHLKKSENTVEPL